MKSLYFTIVNPKVSSLYAICFVICLLAGNTKANAEDNIGCKNKNSINNTISPDLLVPSFVRCIKEEEYDLSFYYYFILDAYTLYDIKRVSDKSSHKVIDSLIAREFADIETENLVRWGEEFADVMSNPRLVKKMCRFVAETGRPSYFPVYMIRSGSSEQIDTQHGLVPDFDEDKAWNEVISTELKCPL